MFGTLFGMGLFSSSGSADITNFLLTSRANGGRSPRVQILRSANASSGKEVLESWRFADMKKFY